MNQKYSNDKKQTVLNLFQSGEPVSSIVSVTNIPRSTIYTWLKQAQNGQSKKEVSVKNFRLLENKIKHLESVIEILQTISCKVEDPLQIKLHAMEELYGQYSVHMLCEALKIPRGTFYNHFFRNKRDNTWYAKRREEYRLKIQQIYDDSNQIFGAAKITAILKEEGYHISVEMVRELMRDMGFVSIRQDAKDLYNKEQRKSKNYLNQQFIVTHPNEVWVSDVTCFGLHNKNYYICVVLDLFSRMVVDCKVGKTNSTQLVKGTFQMAYTNRKPILPLTFHTDCGSNYQSKTFRLTLQSLGVM